SSIGALAFAFTHSHWFNAVEAEVYGISLFFTAMVFYMIVRWNDEADDPKSDRLLLTIPYFIGLSIGVHLLNVLAIPAIALVIYFRKNEFKWSTFLIMVGLTGLAMMVVYPGVVKWLPATFKVNVAIPVITFLVLLYSSYHFLKAKKRIFSLVLVSMLLIVLGYSTYGVIFIRSNLDPPLDENNPDTIERFLSYLNREQYGDVGILPRRWNNDPNYSSEADFFWNYQVNHMYNRYFLWQFVGQEGDFQGAQVDFSKFFALPLLLGLFGLGHHIIRDRKRSLVVFSLFFLTGYAIILYLNQDNPQPRERDYAYTGSFYAFAIWIGIGAQGLLAYASRYLKIKKASQLALLLAALFILIPVNMLAKSYRMHDRSGNYVAWDYSRNILETCEPNGLIFTNGDNDTFPLWYLQEVMAVRQDVRVVNLSLLNTGWYIKQLRNREPKVPISFSDDYIDRYLDQHDLTALRKRYWPKNLPEQPTIVSVPTPDGGSFEWDVPATMHLPTGPGDTGENNFLRVQDIMILHIISENNWKKPLYFAVTVSNSNMLGLQDHLTMEGLAFKFVPEKGNKINPEKLAENLLDNYRDYYRNLDDPNVHYDDNVFRLLQNYRSAYLQLASYYLKLDRPGGDATYDPVRSPDENYEDFYAFSDRDKVLFILDTMEGELPSTVVPISSEEIVLHIGQLYSDLGRPEELEARLQRLSSQKDLTPDELFRYGATYLRWMNDTTTAEKMFRRVLEEDDSPEMKLEVVTAFNQLRMADEAVSLLDEVAESKMDTQVKTRVATLYLHLNQFDTARQYFEELAETNPGDGSVIGGLLSVYEQQKDHPKFKELLESWVASHPNDQQAQQRLLRFNEMYQDSIQ
ncbi:DUF2723 domain-containing protein, partial [bacterium]|nr:DUF2723 domain-containing protein [bacterium]